jgi:hypothetical protein
VPFDEPAAGQPGPLVGMTVHIPIRPSWLCAGCGDAWPCRFKQRELIAEYAGGEVSLRVLMAMRHCDAAGDLPEVPAGELYQRFVGWTRRL